MSAVAPPAAAGVVAPTARGAAGSGSVSITVARRAAVRESTVSATTWGAEPGPTADADSDDPSAAPARWAPSAHATAMDAARPARLATSARRRGLDAGGE